MIRLAMIRLACVVTLLAGPVAALDAFSLPAGCEGIVTMQKRSCLVTHLFTCAGDPAGHLRRVDMVEEGLAFAGLTDSETQWVESNHTRAGYSERLLPGATDPASLTELLATGRDTWDFETQADGYGITRHVGEDVLTGRSIVIDGVTLEETRFTAVAYDSTGTEYWRGEGLEYINRDWRTFISGTRTVTTPTESYDTDFSPVAFFFPGQAGFLSSVPRHDCGVVMSGDLRSLVPAGWVAP